MTEHLDLRLNQLDERISEINSRFDDLKWYIGIAASVVTIMFAVLAVTANLNFSSEKTSLQQFENSEKAAREHFEVTLKADLGKIELPPHLEILNTSRSPLADQEVPVTFFADEGTPSLHFDFIGQNSGDSLSGQLYAKLYTRPPIELQEQSSDEPTFKYEGIVLPPNLSPSELPGRFSYPYHIIFYMKHAKYPAVGSKHTALLKVFYGRGKVERVPITFVVAPSPGTGHK